MIDIQRILCPVDFSEVSQHALQHATTLARWYEARVSVLYVHPVTAPPWVVAPGVGPSGVHAPGLSPLDRSQLEAELQRFATTAGTSVPMEFQVDDGRVAQRIVDTAQSGKADLLVLGTHGRSGVARLLLGSVTEELIHVAPCPVLTVPPRTPPATEASRLFDHILVATDFSDAAVASLRYALSLALEADSQLTVLHVVEPPPASNEDEWLTRSGGPSVLEQLKESGQKQLARAVPAQAREWCRITERLEVGRSYREILRVANEEHAGLIVLGAHGYGVLEKVFFGSTAHHVVRRATCPVLTVRPRPA